MENWYLKALIFLAKMNNLLIILLNVSLNVVLLFGFYLCILEHTFYPRSIVSLNKHFRINPILIFLLQSNFLIWYDYNLLS